MKPFESDGCSWWPDGNYNSCCVTHDRYYWMGGGIEERRAADLELYYCILGRAGQVMALTMWIGVRLFGHPLMPSGRFRWGYGHKWPQAGPKKVNYI